jgi:hypothetical protein
MLKLIPLRCPTCGAKLQVAAEANQFSCNHCGNAYLLERKVQAITPQEREQLSPLTTYTHQFQQWLKVGSHEILVHQIFEETIDKQRYLFANVEYRNNSSDTLSCRRSQWILFDADGYTYDTEGNSDFFQKLERPALGGERFINPGLRVRGWIAFKIPAAAVIERLQFLTGYLSTKTAEFLLNQ